MLLQVTKLLTTMASPMTAIEDEHGDVTMQRVGQPYPVTLYATRLQGREVLTGAKCLHAVSFSASWLLHVLRLAAGASGHCQRQGTVCMRVRLAS